ncbi:Coronin-7 [Mactra antiquata]
MAWRFKVSKFKNAAPRYPKREEWIQDIPVGMMMQSCGNHIAASNDYIAFNVDSGGGGNVGVLPLDTKGRVGQSLPLLHAHGDYVTDIKFSPFNNQLLATCSADTTVKIWNLPETERLSENIVTSSSNNLPGQQHRIEVLAWNTVADNILATGVSKYIKLFDVTSLEEKYEFSNHGDQVQSLCWNGSGTYMVTSCKDKKIRIIDPRGNALVQECHGHRSNRDCRAIFLGDNDYILTTGFNMSREREVMLFDSRKLGSPVKVHQLDNSNGTLMPLFDEDTNMLMLVGKGDTSWSYFEVSTSDPYLTQNNIERTEKSEQIKGACFIPKLSVNVMEGEVDRLILLLHNTIIPLPYIVPRRQYTDFHSDLFPDTKSDVPALTSDQWFNGQNNEVTKTSLNPDVRSKQQRTASSGDKIQSSKTETIVSDSSKQDKSSTVTSSKPSPQQQNTVQKSSVTTSISTIQKPSVQEPVVPSQPPKPSKAAKAFASLHLSKCKYLKGVSEHPSKHIVNIRKLCRTLPGQSNIFCANNKRCAFPIEGSGGLVAILELGKPGRLPDTGVPVVQNGSKVNDFMFDPFDDNRILVGCDNAKVYVWTLPDDGLTETLTDYDSYLMSHTEKIYFLRFHPLAKDVVLTASYDLTIKIWDLSDNTEQIELLSHEDEIFSAEWSPDGKYIATVCKDKKIRIYDPRTSQEPIKVGTGPDGSRGARIVWVLNMKYLFVSGFNKSSQRLLSIYSVEKLDKALYSFELEVSPAVLVPKYDEGTNTIFLTGRGEGTILAIEVSEEYPHLYPLETTKLDGLHQSIDIMSKTTCNVRNVEIARLWRLTQTAIEPISFTVPRVKTDYFQDDLFPPVVNNSKPIMSSQEWFSGVNKIPEKISLRPSDMKPLSEAPVEAPKAKKYDSYNADTYKTDDMKKEELISAMTSKLDIKEEPLPQDEAEGVDSDEWGDD